MGLSGFLQFRVSGPLNASAAAFWGYVSLIELVELRGFGRTYGA